MRKIVDMQIFYRREAFVLVLAVCMACGTSSGTTSTMSEGTQTEPDAADPNDTATTTASPTNPTLDVNQYLALTTDNTQSASVALGSRYATAAKVTPTATQKTFLTDPTKSPSVPTSGDNSDFVYQTFAVTLYPSADGKPSPIDIMQHAIGNCDGDAALAALAYGHPDFITSIISSSGTNTWNVKMYAPNGNAMVVGVNNQFVATSDGSIGAVSGRNGVANWATVLEKALMKYNTVYGVSTSGGMAQIGGIGSEHTLPMFTGSGLSYAFDRGVLSVAQLRQEVLDALDNGMLVTGGFGIEASVDGYQTVTGHAYTLLVPANGNTMVSMRNPWGLAVNSKTNNYDASADGVINLPMNANWAATVDLRVIDPGVAGHAPTTTAYTPDISRRASDLDVEAIARSIRARQAKRAGSPDN